MTDARLALIHFLTHRQGDLQGLRDFAFALCALATMGLGLLVPPSTIAVDRVLVIAVPIVLLEGSGRLVDWWYTSRYGRVSGAGGQSTGATVSMLLGFGAALDLTPWFPVGGYSAFVIVSAIRGLRVAMRDFPWRGYHLALVALPGLAPLVPHGASLPGHYPAYATTLATLAVVALLDHRLLRVSVDRLKRQGEAGSSA